MCSWFYKMLHFLSTITRDKGYKKIISERILCIHLTASYVLRNHNCQLCLYAFFCLFVCFFISRGFTTKSRSKGALYLLQSSKILIMKDFQLLLHNDIFSENKMTRICVNFQTSLNLQQSIPKIHVNCLAPS